MIKTMEGETRSVRKLTRLGLFVSFSLAAAGLSLLLTSCLNLESIRFHVSIDPSDLLSGHALIDFTGIHSTEGDQAEQKKEIEELKLSYRDDAARMIEIFPLSEWKVDLYDVKELSCNGRIEGNVRNSIAVLSGIFGEGDLRIERTGNRLTLFWKNPLKETDNIVFELAYPGKIISHNSKAFDAKTGTMRWNLSAGGDREVSFTIAAADSP